jgi:hypothetical protein
MKRNLFTFFSALSLLLCVWVCVLWVRSFALEEGYAWFRPSPFAYLQVSVRSGRCCVYRNRGTPAPADTARGVFHYRSAPLAGPAAAGFAFDTLGTRQWILSLPCWFAAAALLVPPALRLRLACSDHLSHGRRRRNRCLICGYDLRATPERCPECGSVPSSTNPPAPAVTTEASPR